jgi:hypothetical protein
MQHLGPTPQLQILPKASRCRNTIRNDVRFGSLADISASPWEVSFLPLETCRWSAPMSAKCRKRTFRQNFPLALIICSNVLSELATERTTRGHSDAKLRQTDGHHKHIGHARARLRSNGS